MEDNKNGGMFSFFFNVNSEEDRDKLDDAWKKLLIEAVRGNLDRVILNLEEKDVNTRINFDINGLVVTPKSSSGQTSYKFEIWTKSCHKIEDCVEFLKVIRELVDEKIEIKFTKHNVKKGK